MKRTWIVWVLSTIVLGFGVWAFHSARASAPAPPGAGQTAPVPPPPGTGQAQATGQVAPAERDVEFHAEGNLVVFLWLDADVKGQNVPIFNALLRLADKGLPVKAVTVTAKLVTLVTRPRGGNAPDLGTLLIIREKLIALTVREESSSQPPPAAPSSRVPTAQSTTARDFCDKLARALGERDDNTLWKLLDAASQAPEARKWVKERFADGILGDFVSDREEAGALVATISKEGEPLELVLVTEEGLLKLSVEATRGRGLKK